MINIVRTKGKAGYFVWKLAGGQGDQDINLPWGSFEINFFFDFLDIRLSVANPLLIIKNKFYLNKNVSKRRLYYLVEFYLLLFERRVVMTFKSIRDNIVLIATTFSRKDKSSPNISPNTF